MRRSSRLQNALCLLSVAVLTLPVTLADVAAQPRAETGAFAWYDLVTTQSSAAREFYGKLLGWTFRDTDRNGRPYAIVLAEGRAIGGIVAIDPAPDIGSQWISYLLVDDVERATQEAQSAGGRTLVPPTQVPRGTVAVVADPQGAPLGLGRASIPPTAAPDAQFGHFFWTDYIATDGPGALRFYERVAGLTAGAPAALGAGTYVVLRNVQPRAGLFVLPAGTENIRSHWLPHVRVADPAVIAARATALGGDVLLEPRQNVRNGTLAIIADPSGAAIAVQKWPM